jgi:hypothetical protein
MKAVLEESRGASGSVDSGMKATTKRKKSGSETPKSSSTNTQRKKRRIDTAQYLDQEFPEETATQPDEPADVSHYYLLIQYSIQMFIIFVKFARIHNTFVDGSKVVLMPIR